MREVNGMKKIIVILSAIIIALFSTVPVFAAGGRCGYNGCGRSTANCHNGTVYCDTHAAAYARKSGYSTCAASGCYDYKKSGSSYCWTHTCSDRDCNNKATTNRGYCSTHKCKYSGCTSEYYYTSGKWKGYCNNHAWQLSGMNNKTSSTKKYSSTYGTTKKKTSSSSKKKYDMPDCDDYDSYDDFMDDWDGCMPDGSDAEDYWENW